MSGFSDLIARKPDMPDMTGYCSKRDSWNWVNLIQQLPIDNPVSVEDYINIDKAIDLNNSVDDDTLMQQIVDTVNQADSQEDKSIQSERLVTSSEALVEIDSIFVSY